MFFGQPTNDEKVSNDYINSLQSILRFVFLIICLKHEAVSFNERKFNSKTKRKEKTNRYKAH